jgi:DNA-binding CsgD family transcriptional regulator
MHEREANAVVIDSVANSDTPAFATDAAGHILVWNRGMEKLLGRPRKEALGRRCFELLAGRDVFGNRFCHENCTVLSMGRKGEAIKGFEMAVRSSSCSDLPVQVSILESSGAASSDRSVFHFLQPIDSTARLARALERLTPGDGANGRGRTATSRIPLSGSPVLTLRENEVLRHVAAGLQNKEVARELGISVATTRNHVHNILEKLEVHSKLEAVSLAFREGWVTGSASAGPRDLERSA